MTKLSRRKLLAASSAGASLGLLGVSTSAIGGAAAQSSELDLEKWVQELPVPDVREPDGQHEGAEYHEVTLSEFEQQLHPDLPATTVWGFDGSYPGPTIRAHSGEPVALRFDNSQLPDDHLLDVDDSIGGTQTEDYPHYDGPVPDVRNSVHVHGANVPPESDGQSMAWRSPDDETGPGYVTDVQTIPNAQDRATLLYHPHSLGLTRLNVYAGLVGCYEIVSEAEENLALPDGEHDVPLLLQDRSFEEDGSISYPEEWVSEFSGDTAVVNGAVWPSLEVEPRRYRFRIVNGSNARSFDLSLANEDGTDVPTIYQIAPSHEFLESVVSIGAGETMPSLTLTPFERAEVVVDFSEYAGETLTLTNDAAFPYMGENSGSDLADLVQFRVTEETVDDASAHPTDLDLPEPTDHDPDHARRTRTHTMGMEVADGGVRHVLNDRGMLDDGGTVRPHLNRTEIWELENDTALTHPIHLHLVKFRVLGRGPDGTDEPDPNEQGPKDVVRVDPDETVRIAAEFGDYTGAYPWHCHMLEHEDHSMMQMFDVVPGELVDYADGGVLTDGSLEAASADWEAGELERDALAEAINRWRDGTPVVDDAEVDR